MTGEFMELAENVKTALEDLAGYVGRVEAERDLYRRELGNVIVNVGSPSFEADPRGNWALLENSIGRARRTLAKAQSDALEKERP